ncbi:hypothetical protein AGMMS50249_6880 [candidate division SR1 bacterium]|nr:hypothetical protein AGMMS50249_6880 [candidate division SR1 bacterium]
MIKVAFEIADLKIEDLLTKVFKFDAEAVTFMTGNKEIIKYLAENGVTFDIKRGPEDELYALLK